MARAARLGALLVLLQASGSVQAQSIEACMGAEPAEAVTICGALIDAGRADAAVHTQLVLSLDKSGRSEDARRALERGLAAWENDRDLLALRDRLDASSSERERLEQAGRRNASALSQGRLRLLCLTKRSTAGLEACREYLGLTNKDGDRVRARLAELEGELAPTLVVAPSPEPSTDPVADTGSTAPAGADDPPTVSMTADPPPDAPDGTTPAPPTPIAESASTPDPIPAAVPDAARRARVADIQRALNALGLEAGSPDGLPGRRTREALARFGRRTGANTEPALDERTLEKLESARADHDAALDLLERSRASARGGAPDEALRELARAEATSPLLSVPSGYRAELEAAREEVRRVAVTTPVPTPTPSTSPSTIASTLLSSTSSSTPPTPPDADRSLGQGSDGADALVVDAPGDEPGAADTVDALMTLIGTLERRLADGTTARERDDARQRDLVERVLEADAPR